LIILLPIYCRFYTYDGRSNVIYYLVHNVYTLFDMYDEHVNDNILIVLVSFVYNKCILYYTIADWTKCMAIGYHQNSYLVMGISDLDLQLYTFILVNCKWYK